MRNREKIEYLIYVLQKYMLFISYTLLVFSLVGVIASINNIRYFMDFVGILAVSVVMVLVYHTFPKFKELRVKYEKKSNKKKKGQ